ncbi:hypothetical protein GTQ99_02475 [Kineococcus sp. T13]|uniref:hypothetical protein n=1 Tax=Kineococcus vitellinus TaxID=2696565 RepID=UPI001411FD79|nr:hypothetical protein [Kineococcus vitellinus]NAZ74292.1 hypothetical protein [Kineococcus vitellinus]
MNAATRRHAAQTAEALRIRELAQQVAQRYSNLGIPQRAGHLFEVMHEATFNHDAIAKGSRIRASTTEWVKGGSQSAPADLHIRDEGGRLLAAAQAKLMGKATTAASGISHERYEGMQRLIGADKLARVEDLLDRRLQMNPEGLKFDDYVDARAHVTDTLHLDTTDTTGTVGNATTVSSRPVSTEQAHHAATNPSRWGDKHAASVASHEIGAAMAFGAATGAAVAGLMEAATQAARVRAGETSAAAAAATAAGAAAMGAVRSASGAGLGKAIGIAAQAGALPAAFGQGSVPSAMAGAVVDITAAGVAFARGDIDSAELAARCCDCALQATLVGVCGGLGQTVIPVPVVGGLVGAVVGQTAATLISQGLRAASAAVRAELAAGEDLDAELLAALEDETASALATAILLGEAERALGEERNTYVSATVGPLLDDALIAVTSAGPDEALKRLAEVARCFTGQPLFVTVDEFDAWMADPMTSLTLNPNWR